MVGTNICEDADGGLEVCNRRRLVHSSGNNKHGPILSYSKRVGVSLRAGRASSQVSEGQRSLIGPLYSAPNNERYESFGLLGAYDTNCVGKVGVSICECMCLH